MTIAEGSLSRRDQPTPQPREKPASEVESDQLSAGAKEKGQSVTEFVFKAGMSIPGRRSSRRGQPDPQPREKAASEVKSDELSAGAKEKGHKPQQTVFKAGKSMPGRR